MLQFSKLSANDLFWSNKSLPEPPTPSPGVVWCASEIKAIKVLNVTHVFFTLSDIEAA